MTQIKQSFFQYELLEVCRETAAWSLTNTFAHHKWLTQKPNKSDQCALYGIKERGEIYFLKCAKNERIFNFILKRKKYFVRRKFFKNTQYYQIIYILFVRKGNMQ